LLDYDLGESFRRTRRAAAVFESAPWSGNPFSSLFSVRANCAHASLLRRASSMAPLPSVMAFLPLLTE
jgi:hypothetical protein